MVLVKVKRATPPRRPLAIDLFCGLGGWSHGLLAEGYDVIGYDIERHAYDDHAYPGKLVLQDVLTIHGSQFKDADLIVASPPCQEYSYMAMPWSRAKQIARGLRGQDEFPEGYRGSRTLKELTALFDACFRIQCEASASAGRHIPLVVENVRGAQPWVGRARAHFGSFYLWGDVPALMPTARKGQKFNPDGTAHPPGSWFAIADSKNRGAKVPGLQDGRFPAGGLAQGAIDSASGRKNPGFRFDGSGRSFQSASVEGTKTLAHVNRRDGHSHTRHLTNQREHDAARGGIKQAGWRAKHYAETAKMQMHDGVRHAGDWFSDPSCPSRQGGITYSSGTKQAGISGPRANGKGDARFQDGAARHGSKSSARKAASARIAMIPERLARHIARWFKLSDVERLEAIERGHI